MKAQGMSDRVVVGLALLGAVACAFAAGLLISEFIVIGVIADPATVTAYAFGSESMRSHSGWRYESRTIYAWSSLFEGVLLVIVAGIFVWAAKRRSTKGTAIGYATALIWYAGTWLL